MNNEELREQLALLHDIGSLTPRQITIIQRVRQAMLFSDAPQENSYAKGYEQAIKDVLALKPQPIRKSAVQDLLIKVKG